MAVLAPVTDSPYGLCGRNEIVKKMSHSHLCGRNETGEDVPFPSISVDVKQQ